MSLLNPVLNRCPVAEDDREEKDIPREGEDEGGEGEEKDVEADREADGEARKGEDEDMGEDERATAGEDRSVREDDDDGEGEARAEAAAAAAVVVASVFFRRMISRESLERSSLCAWIIASFSATVRKRVSMSACWLRISASFLATPFSSWSMVVDSAVFSVSSLSTWAAYRSIASESEAVTEGKDAGVEPITEGRDRGRGGVGGGACLCISSFSCSCLIWSCSAFSLSWCCAPSSATAFSTARPSFD